MSTYRSFFAATLLLAGIGSTVACDQGAPGSPPGAAPAQASAAKEVVWPAARAFETAAVKAEGAAEGADLEAMREAAKALKKSATEVAGFDPPRGVKDPVRVKSVQAEIQSIADLLGDSAAMTAEQLKKPLLASHTLGAALFEAAGMVHKHDHGHEGHDHAHDHDGHDHSH